MRLSRLILALLALTYASAARAHLLPAQTATMNIVGASAYCVVSVPASALSGIDDDHSGGLSLWEITRHRQDIATQFAARFHLSDDHNPVQFLPGWVSSPQTEGRPVDQRYVVVLLHAVFARAPVHPAVTTDLFGTGADEAQMTLTATRGPIAEVAILTPDNPSHTWFRGRLATLLDFVRVGVGHILTGPDHLLFLLTVIVAAAGWRYWLSVVTAFTIAHSITLTLAALGVVRVSPALVEPGIAASIVVMALANLRGSGLAHDRQTQRVAIVFACGLLHGLGFASAIGAMAVDTGHRLATLAGFNIGIELGQFMFLGGVVGLGMIARRLFVLPDRIDPARIASMIAAPLGAAMLIARVLPVLV